MRYTGRKCRGCRLPVYDLGKIFNWDGEEVDDLNCVDSTRGSGIFRRFIRLDLVRDAPRS